jgi:alpha-amylase
MTDVCLGFEVHQPYRVSQKFKEDLARGKSVEELFDLYFDNSRNKEILQRVARKCYRPAGRIILENIERAESWGKKFKVSYSISGVLLEQLEKWAPDVLELFKQLAATGCVEFLNQTYYHSLASLFSAEREEFVEQVLMHRAIIRDLFGQEPEVFENTEFIYNNSIARTVYLLGFKGMFTEGAERILGWRSPNYVYRAKDVDLKVFLRNCRLTDDIAFRFSAWDWPGFPLTADKYAAWLAATPGQCINIFMDYETLGEHQWPETGIHEFLRWLPGEVLKWENLRFVTPSELLRHEPVGEVDVFEYGTLSWADVDKGLKAWLGNGMQLTCYRAVKEMEPYVKKLGDERFLKLWRMFQISDNIYYMYQEFGPSGMVHGYFSQMFPTDAFAVFTRAFSDFQEKLMENLSQERSSLLALRIFPPEKAFHFFEGGRYLGSVFSLLELWERLGDFPESCLQVNLEDLEKWVRWTIGDPSVADRISELKSRPNVRQGLAEILARRFEGMRVRGL